MRNNNLIAISCQNISDRETVAKIIQYIVAKKIYKNDDSYIEDKLNEGFDINLDYSQVSNYEIKRFEDPIKDYTCILLSCNRQQLEDKDFLDKELGEEWWKYKLHDGSVFRYISKEDYNLLPKDVRESNSVIVVKPTPRSLLQLIGNEEGRDMIHPDMFVNALFSKYKLTADKKFMIIDTEDGNNIEDEWKKVEDRILGTYPNWIITDLRFPNEAKAIQDRNGLLIRVNNQKPLSPKVFNKKGIESYQLLEFNYDGCKSETPLDNYDSFDEVIDNNGAIEELVEKVKEILIRRKII